MKISGIQITMRGFGKTLLLILCCTPLPLLAESRPLTEAVGHAQAVAFVRVQKASQEVRNEKVHHVVTFEVCGRASGVPASAEVEVEFDRPAKPSEPIPEELKFAAGGRCILLLHREQNQWQVVDAVKTGEDGNVCADQPGEDIGLKDGMSAEAAVEIIAFKIKRERLKDRPQPSPTARNQPWNLMRSSPLRRVWPFFPR
ncbi:MAG: hypothetical protein QM790_15085 [Nibricoccus sp.]